jgi:hypothetical protein
VESTVPSGHHTWADLLNLVGSIRRLAFARNLPASEAFGRIRDAFQDYDHQGGASWKE